LDVASDDVKEKIERFKELIKKGFSVRRALRESGLRPQEYKKYYDEIWSYSEMRPYMPQMPLQPP